MTVSKTIAEIYQENRAVYFHDEFGAYVHNTSSFLPELLCVPRYIKDSKELNYSDKQKLDASALEINYLFRGKQLLVQTSDDLYRVPFSFPLSLLSIQQLMKSTYEVFDKRVLSDYARKTTFIYLIRDADTGFTKIGRSNDPKQRLKELTKQPTLLPKPFDFKFIRYWQDFPVIEKYLHAEYSHKSIRGEWFDLDASDLDKIHGFVNSRNNFL